MALKTVTQLQEPIKALLKDDDQYLRIDAIRTLATVDNQFTRQALRDALLDSQPLVQQAAEAALKELTRGDTVWAAADSSRDTVPLPVPPRLSPSEPPPASITATAAEVSAALEVGS